MKLSGLLEKPGYGFLETFFDTLVNLVFLVYLVDLVCFSLSRLFSLMVYFVDLLRRYLIKPEISMAVLLACSKITSNVPWSMYPWSSARNQGTLSTSFNYFFFLARVRPGRTHGCYGLLLSHRPLRSRHRGRGE